jgi:hypothetical protein
MEKDLEQLSNDIKDLKQKCCEINTTHSFLNEFFYNILDKFDKETKTLTPIEKQTHLIQIIRNWHWFYCLFYDEFLYYFHHKTIGKRTLFLKSVLKLRSFDEINTDMKNIVDKRIGKKQTRKKMRSIGKYV